MNRGYADPANAQPCNAAYFFVAGPRRSVRSSLAGCNRALWRNISLILVGRWCFFSRSQEASSAISWIDFTLSSESRCRACQVSTHPHSSVRVASREPPGCLLLDPFWLSRRVLSAGSAGDRPGCLQHRRLAGNLSQPFCLSTAIHCLAVFGPAWLTSSVVTASSPIFVPIAFAASVEKR
jgi:hypothetical protein